MKDIDDYQNTFFAASNTGAGFVSYFDEIFGDCKRLYILKGGPGTGKSYFMNRIGKEAELRGDTVRRYLCSSDPDSLDGIYIEKMSIAILDGTSPHVVEPKLPGAREEIVNLGQFWDGKKLQKRCGEIDALAKKKQSAYRAALKHLHLAGSCMSQRLELLTPYLEREKLTRAAKRFVSKRAKGRGKVLPCPLHTHGMKGEITLDPFSKSASRVLCLTPHYGAEYLYLREILLACREMGVGVLYSPHPLCSDLPEAVYWEEEGILVTATEKKQGKMVGCRRFLTKEAMQCAPLVRYLQKASVIMTAAAGEEFAKMRQYHFTLEEIYKETMDFAAKERFTEAFLDTLFD